MPSKEYKDFQAFQRREVAGLMKEMTDIVHAYGKEAMMFLGDHWIGCEPFMPEFRKSAWMPLSAVSATAAPCA